MEVPVEERTNMAYLKWDGKHAIKQTRDLVRPGK